MIALIQRVTTASVKIHGKVVASIDGGLLALIGIRPTDDLGAGAKLLARMLHYRVFSDAAGKMNVSLTETQGGLLLVPQFTLAAETAKGLRPGFSTAAPPGMAKELFEGLVAAARARHAAVAAGIFGADMQVSLTNDGPVTFWLEGGKTGAKSQMRPSTQPEPGGRMS